MPNIDVRHGDCIDVMRDLARAGTRVQAVVTDPPYELGFMGKRWDKSAVSFRAQTWRCAFDLLAPGGHLLSFGGTRSWHRIGVAIEDAGFDIRDSVLWLYGTGFPKSHDMARAIDKELGVEGETVPIGAPVRRLRPGADQHKDGSWEKLTDRTFQPGEYIPASEEAWAWREWGTGLKPAWEPVIVARKPLAEATVAANVLAHGAGAINEDGCAVQTTDVREHVSGRPLRVSMAKPAKNAFGDGINGSKSAGKTAVGRHPANLVHDGGAEVRAAFAAFGESTSRPSRRTGHRNRRSEFKMTDGDSNFDDSGDASRFFYSAKADRLDRWGSRHPTVKPIALMRWLVRLVTPPGGTVLDPFAGTGTTGVAALAEGFGAVLIEQEAEHVRDIEERLAFYRGEGRHYLAREAEREPHKAAGADLPLFASERP